MSGRAPHGYHLALSHRAPSRTAMADRRGRGSGASAATPAPADRRARPARRVALRRRSRREAGAAAPGAIDVRDAERESARSCSGDDGQRRAAATGRTPWRSAADRDARLRDARPGTCGSLRRDDA
jgi:hypothetical protein